jgi:hypothetical protein
MESPPSMYQSPMEDAKEQNGPYRSPPGSGVGMMGQPHPSQSSTPLISHTPIPNLQRSQSDPQAHEHEGEGHSHLRGQQTTDAASQSGTPLPQRPTIPTATPPPANAPGIITLTPVDETPTESYGSQSKPTVRSQLHQTHSSWEPPPPISGSRKNSLAQTLSPPSTIQHPGGSPLLYAGSRTLSMPITSTPSSTADSPQKTSPKRRNPSGPGRASRPAKRKRICPKCGEECPGSGGVARCKSACKECGKESCKGKNSRKPEEPCPGSLSDDI